jgi:flagellin
MSLNVDGKPAGLTSLANFAKTEQTAPAQLPRKDASPAAVDVVDAAGVDQLATSRQALARMASIVDVSLAAGDAAIDVLSKMRSLSAAAKEPDAEARDDMDAGFKSRLAELRKIVGEARFDGVNLLDGSQSGSLEMAADAEGGAPLAVTPQDLTPGGSNITLDDKAGLHTPQAAGEALASVNSSMARTIAAMDVMTAEGKRVDNHNAFLGRFEAVQAAAVQPDLDAEGARLMALQVQQQLSGLDRSIANAAPKAVLALFK